MDVREILRRVNIVLSLLFSFTTSIIIVFVYFTWYHVPSPTKERMIAALIILLAISFYLTFALRSWVTGAFFTKEK
ncbi:hypothetical protein ACFLZ2_02035 [Candidatus Margulisiibacteriota bacterium]